MKIMDLIKVKRIYSSTDPIRKVYLLEDQKDSIAHSFLVKNPSQSFEIDHPYYLGVFKQKRTLHGALWNTQNTNYFFIL